MSRSSQRKKKVNNKRRNKDKDGRAYTQQLLQSTTMKQQADIQKQNIKTSFLSYIYNSRKPRVVLKKSIVVLSFFLSFLGIYSLFYPRVIPSIIMPQNTNFPFEIFLNITNSGYFDILDVEPIPTDFKYTSNIKQPLTMYTHDPHGKLAGEKPPRIERIKPNHSEVIDLRKMFGLLSGRAESASFSITIKYSVWYWLKPLSQKHYYKLSRTVTGAYIWQELSYKEASQTPS